LIAAAVPESRLRPDRGRACGDRTADGVSSRTAVDLLRNVRKLEQRRGNGRSGTGRSRNGRSGTGRSRNGRSGTGRSRNGRSGTEKSRWKPIGIQRQRRRFVPTRRRTMGHPQFRTNLRDKGGRQRRVLRRRPVGEVRRAGVLKASSRSETGRFLAGSFRTRVQHQHLRRIGRGRGRRRGRGRGRRGRGRRRR